MRNILLIRKRRLISTFFLLPQLCLAQVSQEWVARYSRPGFDAARSVAVDASGNVYVTGTSGGEYGTIKYNSAGVLQWEARYNGPGVGNDEANALALDAAGNVYVTGQSEGIGTRSDYTTIKYNTAGVQQWEARYNGPDNTFDEASALAVDAAGNVYVTGSSTGDGTGSDYATIKYNANGVQQWAARYNGAGNGTDVATALAVDAGGNVYITGGSGGTVGAPEFDAFDYTTIKYNAGGVQQWEARYNGPGNHFDFARSLAIDVTGNVYVTGGSTGSGTDRDYATIKYNSAGVQKWVARYNSPTNFRDDANDLAVDNQGNVYVTGEGNREPFINPDEATSAEFATVKYNAGGNQLWVATNNGPFAGGIDVARAIAIDASGNVYITGESVTGESAVGQTFEDYATIKYNTNGVEQWEIRYNGSGDLDDDPIDLPGSLAIDALGNVYVTGLSRSNGTGLDYATIKYAQLKPGNKQNFVIGGINYFPCNPSETVVAPFTTTAGNVTTNLYSGLVLLTVSGTGQSAGTSLNDAFYFNIPENPTHLADFFQLVTTTGTSVFSGGLNPNDTYRHIVYDVNAGTAVTPPYVPPFRTDNTYTFIINLNTLVPAPAGPSILRFGVDDGVVIDNSGAYTIHITQLCEGCGNKGNKALICHKGKEICISQDDVEDHLDHGDVLGRCPLKAARATTTEGKGFPEQLRAFNTPNPASVSTKIFYELPVDGHVTIKVFDMLGRVITTLVDADMKVGYHNKEFNVSAFQKGLYYYHITVTAKNKIWVQTGKISVVK